MNTTLNEILETYPDDSFLIADGFDDAVIGLDEQSMRLVYSVSKCIAILKSEGMTGEDIVKDYHRRGAFDYAIIRPSAVYGPLDVEDRVVASLKI